MRCSLIQGIRKPEPDHRPSQLLLHQCFVLLILCILCIDVNCEKNRFPGLAPPPHRISLPLSAQLLRLPPQRGVIPWERGRPARTLFLLRHAPAPVPGRSRKLGHRRSWQPAAFAAWPALSFNAMLHPVGGNSIEPGRRSRLIQVVEMTEAVPGFVRAGRPRSREAFIP